MTIAAFVSFFLWCGFVWRLRGGALRTLLGIDVGTQATRALCSGAICLLAAAGAGLMVDLLAFVALWVGLGATGWGPFQGDGLSAPLPLTPERSWLRWFPRALGLVEGTMAYDTVGLCMAGLVCMAPLALVCGYASAWRPLSISAPLVAGALFPVPYAIARLGLPSIPNFASGQAWGEVGAGILVGAALGFVFIL